MVWEMKQIFNAHALCMLGFWLSSEIARGIAFLFLVYEGVMVCLVKSLMVGFGMKITTTITVVLISLNCPHITAFEF